MWEYTDKTKEHFLRPRNVGELEDADAVAEVGSIACGDALKLYLKLDDDQRIVDARFKTFGCASAIASSSALTEMVKGMTLEEAEKVTDKQIADFLGGLPKEKMHCSVMGREALLKAISNYRGTPEPAVEGNVVCECFGVTDVEVERAIRENNLTTVEDITNYTKAGGGCGGCVDTLQEILQQVRNEMTAAPPLKPKMTNLQKIKKIEETLEREIRPALRQDGGDIELVDVVGNRVLVATRGACATCQASAQTLENFVEKKLRELVWHELVVEEVSS